VLARYLRSEDASLIACANCLQKKPNVEKKKQTIFLTPTVSKKVKFVKLGVKKANLATLWSRGGLHFLFHLLTCE